MEVRVATGDVERAKLLVVDLVGLFGGARVSLQPDGAVQLHLRGEVNGALAHTLQAVERWLEQTHTASAEVSVDERSYISRASRTSAEQHGAFEVERLE